jgi:hypothetical protein
MLPNHAPDGGRTQDQTSSGQHLSYTFRSHRLEQALQLPHEILDEVGVAVDGLRRLDQITSGWGGDAVGMTFKPGRTRTLDSRKCG